MGGPRKGKSRKISPRLIMKDSSGITRFEERGWTKIKGSIEDNLIERRRVSGDKNQTTVLNLNRTLEDNNIIIIVAAEVRF